MSYDDTATSFCKRLNKVWLDFDDRSKNDLFDYIIEDAKTRALNHRQTPDNAITTFIIHRFDFFDGSILHIFRCKKTGEIVDWKASFKD